MSNMAYFSIVDLRQGTSEWLSWRSNGIGASDAASIMGENPWKSRAQLFKEKCVGSYYSNSKMARGQTLEPEARKRFENKFGVKLSPLCLQSIKHDWLRASLDGISFDPNIVVEIKCGESSYRKAASTGIVPRYYFAQLQHILAVTHFDEIHYWAFCPAKPEIHIRVKRDDEYIKRLVCAEQQFWMDLQTQRLENTKEIQNFKYVNRTKRNSANRKRHKNVDKDFSDAFQWLMQNFGSVLLIIVIILILFGK